MEINVDKLRTKLCLKPKGHTTNFIIQQVTTYIERNYGIPPVMPINCEECPVMSCHKQTHYGGELCQMRLRGSLRRHPERNII